MYKRSGFLATENPGLSNLRSLRDLSLKGFTDRDGVIADLRAKLALATRNMQTNSDNKRLERQKQNTITANQQSMHENLKKEHQLQLRQAQLQQQQQQRQMQLQQQQQQQLQLQQQKQQQKQKMKKEDLTYFDDLDNEDSTTDSDENEECDNNGMPMTYNNVYSSDDNNVESPRNQTRNHRYHGRQRRYTPYQKSRNRNVKYNGNNPPVYQHLQSYYDKR